MELLFKIYLGTIGFCAMGLILTVIYTSSKLKKLGIYPKKGLYNWSDRGLALVKCIFWCLIPVVNVIIGLICIFCAEYIAQNVIETIEIQNNLFDNQGDNDDD